MKLVNLNVNLKIVEHIISIVPKTIVYVGIIRIKTESIIESIIVKVKVTIVWINASKSEL